MTDFSLFRSQCVAITYYLFKLSKVINPFVFGCWAWFWQNCLALVLYVLVLFFCRPLSFFYLSFFCLFLSESLVILSHSQESEPVVDRGDRMWINMLIPFDLWCLRNKVSMLNLLMQILLIFSRCLNCWYINYYLCRKMFLICKTRT